MTAQTATYAETPAPTESPWGHVDHAEWLAPGVWIVHTASHGGIFLSDDRADVMAGRLPDFHPFAGGSNRWWEEDCDWVAPVLVFRAEMPVNIVTMASRMLGRAARVQSPMFDGYRYLAARLLPSE